MQKKDFKKLKIPDSSGVYLFKKGKNILYIGKATNLCDRVRSYFSVDVIETRGSHIVDMVLKSDTIEFQPTDSVLEAIILEVNLIKKFQPYYNTKEKDNKSFNYVCITKEDFPRILIIREREIDFKNLKTKNYKLKTTFGPFPNGGQLKEALNIIRKIFPFRDKKSGTKGSDEFYRQLGLMPDLRFNLPAQAGNEDVRNEYNKTVKNITLFFQGKKKAILKSLEKEMFMCAKRREFEKAGELKRKIFALKHINDISLIKKDQTCSTDHRLSTTDFRVEAYDVAHMGGKNMIGVMTVIEDGEVNKNEYRKFNIKGFSDANDTGALLEMLSRRFAHPEWPRPDLIVVDGGRAQKNVAEKFQKKYGLSIPVVAVVKDERHKPKGILGIKKYTPKYDDIILLANSEAHRFSINAFRNKQRKSFI